MAVATKKPQDKSLIAFANVRPALRRQGIEIQKFKTVNMINRITNVQNSTYASILQNWLLAVVLFIHSINYQLCQ
jgi:hypothetical protein